MRLRTVSNSMQKGVRPWRRKEGDIKATYADKANSLPTTTHRANATTIGRKGKAAPLKLAATILIVTTSRKVRSEGEAGREAHIANPAEIPIRGEEIGQDPESEAMEDMIEARRPINAREVSTANRRESRE